MAEPWTICPSCGWDYEQHGDVHASTRFNCERARNSIVHVGRLDPLTPYLGVIVRVSEADAWHATIRDLMETRRIPFEQAVDAYIREALGVKPFGVPYVAPDTDVA